MRNSYAFTLIEVLTGLAILGVILLAVTQFVSGTVRNYRAAIQLTERTQIESTARDAVVQELSLAGYGLGLVGEVPGPTVDIALGSGPNRSDTFTVHYLEERWLAEPVRRVITLDVARDGSGMHNLYRREEGATRQPAVQEVTSISLAALYDDQGRQLLPHEAWPERLSGMMVRLGFSWGSERLTVITFGVPQPVRQL